MAEARRPPGPFPPPDRAGAPRSLLKRRRELPGHLGPLRELLGIGVGPGRALAAEPCQAVLDVDRVVGPALLPVVDDRQPGLCLLLHDVEHRRARPVVKRGLGAQPPFLSILQERQQVLGPRKASGVGGEDSVRAPLHRVTFRLASPRPSMTKRTRSPGAGNFVVMLLPVITIMPRSRVRSRRLGGFPSHATASKGWPIPSPGLPLPRGGCLFTAPLTPGPRSTRCHRGT